MTPKHLIGLASSLATPFSPSADCTSGSVGAVLVTRSGAVYSGVCVDTACSLGFCAEHAAVAEMLKARECEVQMIVAVDEAGRILPPCGRCRELISQVAATNIETAVVLGPDHTVPLKDLLPLPWIDRTNPAKC